MPTAREWIGGLLLRSPTRLRSLRGLPILGSFIHRLSHRILPVDEKVWSRIEAGPAAGLWLELNPRTGQNYVRGEAEVAIQVVLAERLQAGMVFYDLGANIGLFTLLAARLVGPNGKVFSFEPDGEIATRLRRNIRRNEFANVTVIEAGVWSKSGFMNFVAADSSSPDHGVGRFVAGDNATAGSPTQCMALDDFIENSPPPDAIKCDVEGAEVEALRGAEKLLQSRHTWIICEVHSEASGPVVQGHLSRFGYATDWVDVNHILALPPEAL